MTLNSLHLGLTGTWAQTLALLLISSETLSRSHSLGAQSRVAVCHRGAEAGERVRGACWPTSLGTQQMVRRGLPGVGTGSRRVGTAGTGSGH